MDKLTEWIESLIKAVNLTPSKFLRLVMVLAVIGMGWYSLEKDSQIKELRINGDKVLTAQINRLNLKVDDCNTLRESEKKNADSINNDLRNHILRMALKIDNINHEQRKMIKENEKTINRLK